MDGLAPPWKDEFQTDVRYGKVGLTRRADLGRVLKKIILLPDTNSLHSQCHGRCYVAQADVCEQL